MLDLVTFEIAKKLKENGFDKGCEYTFYNNYRVRDEIYEKHPGLSDDGYEDLRKKYGGPYKDEEVYGYYIEPLKLYSRNSTIGVNPITKQKVPTNQLYSCPNIYQVLKWLRDVKDIDLVISPVFFYDDILGKMREYGCKVFTPSLNKPEHCGYHEEWEQAALAGIEYVLDNLI